MVDFLTTSLIGARPVCVERLGARRPNTTIPSAAGNYNTILQQQVLRHNIVQRVGEAHDQARIKHKAVVKEKLDKIDEETKQYMKGAEKRCRQIKSVRIPFSPESSIWIRRAQVYRLILHYHTGKIGNRGNLQRAARRCGISTPLGLSLEELRLRLKACKTKCNYF